MHPHTETAVESKLYSKSSILISHRAMTDIHFTLLDLGKKIRFSSVHDITDEFYVKRATLYHVPSSRFVEYIVHHPMLVFSTFECSTRIHRRFSIC